MFWSLPCNQVLCLCFSCKPRGTRLLIGALTKKSLKGPFRENYQQTLLRNVNLSYCRWMCSSSCRVTVDLLKSLLYLFQSLKHCIWIQICLFRLKEDAVQVLSCIFPLQCCVNHSYCKYTTQQKYAPIK